MYSDLGLGLLVLAAFVWLGCLTFWFTNQIKFFRSIFPKSGERDIRKKFEEILVDLSNFKADLGKFDEKLKNFEQDELKHIQKIALNRYNPYEDSGGDMSFSLALLDKDGNGFVISSLHARSGTRVFAKPVKKGKGGEYRLSKEEEETIGEAMSFRRGKVS